MNILMLCILDIISFNDKDSLVLMQATSLHNRIEIECKYFILGLNSYAEK